MTRAFFRGGPEHGRREILEGQPRIRQFAIYKAVPVRALERELDWKLPVRHVTYERTNEVFDGCVVYSYVEEE